ncbi:hypothetical protein [Limnohabitans sp.]|uniref:hypothetical protein n=1 Tax=Limnohabitans sp. TaxID=1907725 RepID=UPI0025C626B6|nr:hypothetical protein [Limnohabitans sp.]
MTTIAHPPVQCLKRTASAVLFLLLFSAALSAQAQQAVYRCGQEYTNAPRDPALCEPLAPQAITVISGTRPTPSPAAAAVPAPVPTAVPRRSTPTEPGAAALELAGQPRTPSVPVRTPDVQQSERDAQARTILMQELDKARAQLAQLVQSYNQGEPEKWAAETRNHQKYLDRVAGMLAAIERTERDIDSLQRELARRPVQTSRSSP